MIKTFKYGIAIGAAIMGISGFTGQAHAQTNSALVTAQITVVSGIEATVGLPIDFGTWVLAYRAGNNFTLVMDTTGAVVADNVASVAIPVVAGAGAGNLTVDVPAGLTNTILQMTRGAITNFAGGSGLSLTAVSYRTASQVEAPFAQTVNHPVTVITGGVDEVVNFGATISITAQPLVQAAPHTASFTATFNY